MTSAQALKQTFTYDIWKHQSGTWVMNIFKCHMLSLVGPWSPLPGKFKSKTTITFFNCLEWEPDINSEFFFVQKLHNHKDTDFGHEGCWIQLDSTVALCEKSRLHLKGSLSIQSSFKFCSNSSTSREKMRSKLYLLVVGVSNPPIWKNMRTSKWGSIISPNFRDEL